MNTNEHGERVVSASVQVPNELARRFLDPATGIEEHNRLRREIAAALQRSLDKHFDELDRRASIELPGGIFGLDDSEPPGKE